MRDNDGKTRWVAFMVYGSFRDPDTGLNFFVVRRPEGRVAWTRGLEPALNKVVRGWFSPQELRDDASRRRVGRESMVYWNVEGDPDPTHSLWDATKPSHWEWTGEDLVKVGAHLPRQEPSSPCRP